MVFAGGHSRKGEPGKESEASLEIILAQLANGENGLGFCGSKSCRDRAELAPGNVTAGHSRAEPAWGQGLIQSRGKAQLPLGLQWEAGMCWER